MIELNSEMFDDAVKSVKLVVVDFYASWCGPCKLISKVIGETEEGLKTYDYIRFYKVNTDHEPDVSIRYNVNNLPTLIFFKNGVEAKRVGGMINKEKILEILNELKVGKDAETKTD